MIFFFTKKNGVHVQKLLLIQKSCVNSCEQFTKKKTIKGDWEFPIRLNNL